MTINKTEIEQLEKILDKETQIIQLTKGEMNFYFIVADLEIIIHQINRICSLHTKKHQTIIAIENIINPLKSLPVININILSTYTSQKERNNSNEFKFLGSIIKPKEEFKERIENFASDFDEVGKKLGLFTDSFIDYIFRNLKG